MPPQDPEANDARCPSRFGGFLNAVVESAWLGALICVPLAMEPDVQRGFTPFKCVWIALFGLVALTAWIPGRLDCPAPRRTQGRHWVLPVLFFATFAISILLSLYPAMSLLGSQLYIPSGLEIGLLGVLFACVAAHLARWDQAERLVTALLAPAAAMSLYALYQRLGLDSTAFVVNQRDRVFSFAGHPLFLSGWILIALPFAVWRLASCLVGPGSVWIRRSFGIFYGVLIIILLAAFFFTGSRGPMLALLVGGAYAGVVGGRYVGQRWVTAMACTLAGMGLIGLVTLAILRPAPERGVADADLLARLSATLPIGTGGDRFRDTLWKSAPETLLSPALSGADGKPDRWSALRVLVGFGPENADLVSAQHWSWFEPESNPESTYHNLLWDTLITTGVLGVGALVVFFLGLFHLGYLKLGLLPKGYGLTRFLTLGVSGALVAATFAGGLLGIGYVAIGAQMGVLVFLAAAPFFASRGGPPERVTVRKGLLLAALVALAAHWVEVAFCYQSPVTATCFWILTGLVFALSAPGFDSDPAEEVIESRWQPVFLPALIGTLVTACVLHGFLRKFTAAEFTATEALWNCLFTHPGGRPSVLMGFIVLPSLLAALFVSWPPTFGWKKPLRCLCAAGGLVIVLAGIYALLKSSALAALGKVPVALVPASRTLEQFQTFELVVLSLYLVVPALLAVLAFVIMRRGIPGPRFRVVPVVVLAVVLAASLWAFSDFYRREARSEMAFSYGIVLSEKGDPRNAPEILRASLSANPHVLYRTVEVSKFFETMGVALGTGPESQKFFDESLGLLVAATRLNTLSRAHHELGKLLIQRAERAADPKARRALAVEALKAFDSATLYWPGFEVPWTQKALVEGVLLGDVEGSARSLKIANSRGTTHDEVLNGWAGFYFSLSTEVASPEIKAFYRSRALFYYDHAIQKVLPGSKDAYNLLVGRGTVLRNSGRSKEALEDFLEAIKLGGETWQAEAMAAFAYHDLGRDPLALDYAERALLTAPEAAHPQLQQLKQSIKQVIR